MFRWPLIKGHLCSEVANLIISRIQPSIVCAVYHDHALDHPHSRSGGNPRELEHRYYCTGYSNS